MAELPGAYAVRIHGETILRLTITSSVSSRVEAHFGVLFDDGTFANFDRVASHSAADRTSESFNIGRPATGGWVVEANVARFLDNIKRGELYVSLHVDPTRGAVSRMVAAGYVYNGFQVPMGTVIESGPGGGHGNFRSISGTNPAAGAEVSEVVPTNALWLLRAMQLPIVGGAAAFTPRLAFRDGSDNEFWNSKTITVAGGATESINFGLQGDSPEAAHSSLSLPFLYLPEAYDFTTLGITADDDYGVPQLLVEEWLVI